ncbi:hypothetical protein EV05_1922 [Prochlorococcus sp. MIT 0601]|nr:hypothetical protein EV05_1922 [Prochlorococcus sp. MIT 0601]
MLVDTSCEPSYLLQLEQVKPDQQLGQPVIRVSVSYLNYAALAVLFLFR